METLRFKKKFNMVLCNSEKLPLTIMATSPILLNNKKKLDKTNNNFNRLELKKEKNYS